MWSYILRRLLLMIPTLFGVTVVSFLIMKMAPGDPVLMQLGPGGAAGQSGQTPDAYKIQKRDLKLDKPLFFNTRYFRNYADEVRHAAFFLGRTAPELAEALREMAGAKPSAEAAKRRRFLREIDDNQLALLQRLDELAASEDDGAPADEAQRRRTEKSLRLAQAVQARVQIWCFDHGLHAAPFAREILEEANLESLPADLNPPEPRPVDPKRALLIGAIRGLNEMVDEPFRYTFSREPDAEEAAAVANTWRILWRQAEAADAFSPVSPQRREALQAKLQDALKAESRLAMFESLRTEFEKGDAPFFYDTLLSDEADLEAKAVAAEFLRLYISDRVMTEVGPGAADHELRQAAENWLAHFETYADRYKHGPLAKAAYFIADTQYGHMLWRLVSFHFGRSALKTREPVATKIWNAFIVSAPLMIMAQIVIYLVAVPLGILCAVQRAKLTDRLISLGLYFLYSIPAFVAAMLLLLFFCYGDYLRIFPMEGLHSDGADDYGFVRYALDYLWHAFLPVLCLSLFSLAGMAMYSRTAMLETLGQDYIRTARAKGVSRRGVVLKHALRNSLIPIVTLFANFLPAMLGGSVLIEVLFNIPGMGRMSFTSIQALDIPTVMALIYIDAIVVMVSILLTDILYVFIDPRISFQRQGKLG